MFGQYSNTWFDKQFSRLNHQTFYVGSSLGPFVGKGKWTMLAGTTGLSYTRHPE